MRGIPTLERGNEKKGIQTITDFLFTPQTPGGLAAIRGLYFYNLINIFLLKRKRTTTSVSARETVVSKR